MSADPTTLWSQIRRAAGGDRAALEDLSARYWSSVYAYLRASGRDPETARDLTQAFFVDLLDHEFFSRARPEHGRFRSYLFAALRFFLSDEHDRSTALKRGGGRKVLSLDFDRGERSIDPAATDDPSRAYEREWALQVLQDAFERLKKEATPAVYEAFRAARPGRSHADVAGELGITEQEVANRLRRARVRLRELLIEELRLSVDDPADVEQELADLFRILSRNP
ncbi:MAG: sigma-70 family RNA polymerase sigma factor [Planctomycetes bacterium]|nr:sigma-70 family RNA polymerase sigma factor [Planctomycetota bacterium]